MTVRILQKDAPVLREKAAEVLPADLQSAKVRKILSQMQAALETQDDGVALAAPQIGAPLRIFIISKAALALPKELQKRKEANTAELKKAAGYLVFINPVITKLSREKAVVDEGCLSVRPLYGRVKRAKKATVQAYDERGAKFTRGASGLLAQIFQHETDHLNGILFIDRATDIKELLSPKQQE
jgi:peptide deformylase